MRRYLLVSLIAIVALLVIGAGTLILVNRNKKISNVIEKVANLNTNKTTNVNSANTNSAPVVKADPDPAAITFIVRNFAEQFGTDSTDSASAGLLASTHWTTTTFATQLRKNISTLPAGSGTTFHRLITHALTFAITQRTTSTAAVTIGTQREETTGTTIKKYIQNLNVTLVKDGGQWRVATAAWLPI